MYTFPEQLDGYGIQLCRLEAQHEAGLRTAAADGELWTIRFASVPTPEQTAAYIATAQETRHAYVVIDATNGDILGSTAYYNIHPEIKRLEIGYTWYRQSCWRSHVNTACKSLLLTYAFDVWQANIVGWQTDILNTRSQAAIERLGAHKDGVIRGDRLRRDGSIRDSVMYSMNREEWLTAKVALLERLRV
ncbi:MAG: GNAT family protein [Cardiobacteriaceae bacterium]|nr:GNAT family protein [Cardiobacteriaceae bacterium]